MVLQVQQASYAAAYIMADASKRGLSLTFENVALGNGIVRLTRLR